MYEILLVYTNSQKKYTLPEEIFKKVLTEEQIKKLKEEVRKEVARSA